MVFTSGLLRTLSHPIPDCLLVPNLLTPAECAVLVAAAEGAYARRWTRAGKAASKRRKRAARLRRAPGGGDAAPRGTPIYAAGDGVISYAGRKGGYGNYIAIRHNGRYSTAYAHMKGFARGMGKGKRVRQGQVIGYVGTTGRSTGPHLHYELIHNSSQIDPATVNRGDKATVLPAAYRDAFQRDRRYREDLLDNSRRVSAQVVADAAQR